MKTVYELVWGSDRAPEQRRYFEPTRHTDAVVRLSERVIEMDRDPNVSAAYASLRQLPEGNTLAAWTKTSDERPTDEGSETPPST